MIQSVTDLKSAFADSVRDYIAVCQERGEEPEKPYSGQFLVRVAPPVHRAVAVAARKAGQSLNKWVAMTLERAALPLERSASNIARNRAANVGSPKRRQNLS